jgi:hypothetical protein
MVNRWVEFVKNYAKEQNISYTCAMCEIKTKGLYKPLKKEAIKEEPKIFSKIVKVKKQKQKKQKEEEEDEEVPKLDLELPNAADNYIKLMNEYVDKYNLTELKQYIIGNTFKEKKDKAVIILKQLEKDLKELDNSKNMVISDDNINLVDFIKNVDKTLLSKYTKMNTKTILKNMNSILKNKTK